MSLNEENARSELESFILGTFSFLVSRFQFAPPVLDDQQIETLFNYQSEQIGISVNVNWHAGDCTVKMYRASGARVLKPSWGDGWEGHKFLRPVIDSLGWDDCQESPEVYKLRGEKGYSREKFETIAFEQARSLFCALSKSTDWMKDFYPEYSGDEPRAI